MSYVPPHLRQSLAPEPNPTTEAINSSPIGNPTGRALDGMKPARRISTPNRPAGIDNRKTNKTSSPLTQPSDRHASDAILQARALRFGSPSPVSSPSRGKSSDVSVPLASPSRPTSSPIPGDTSNKYANGANTDRLALVMNLEMEDRQMESLGTLSRSGGVGSRTQTPSGRKAGAALGIDEGAGVLLGEDGDALKDLTVQERYMAYIDRRLVKFNRLHPTYLNSRSLTAPAPVPVYAPSPQQSPTPPNTTRASEDMSSIMLCFRKLREGVSASGREDAFAVRVYESSATYALLSANHPQIVSSLSILVPGLYARSAFAIRSSAPEVGRLATTTTTFDPSHVSSASAHLHEDVAGLTITERTAALRHMQHTPGRPTSSLGIDNRGLYACLFLTYTICHLGDIRGWWKLWFRLTLPPARRRGRREGMAEARGTPPGEKAVPQQSEEFVSAVEPYMVIARQAFEAFTAPSPLRFAALGKRTTADNAPEADPTERLRDELLRATLDFGKTKAREKSWAIMRGAYRDLGAQWASRLLLLGNEAEGSEQTDNKTLDKWEDGKLLGGVQTWAEAHGARLDGTRVIIKG